MAPRSLLLIALGALAVVPAAWTLRAVQIRAGRPALLREAEKQRDVAKRPDLALGYLDRYLALVPDDRNALDQRARLLAETAREPSAVDAAIQAHVALIGRGGDAPALLDARERLAELYLRVHQFRPAELAAREYLKRGRDDAEGHRLLARALEGAGRLGDARALGEAVAEFEAAEAREPGDVATAERLARLYRDKYADRGRALAVLDGLLRHNPRSPTARLARSRFFGDEGENATASSEIDAALRVAPGDVDARLAAAEAAANRLDPAGARLHLRAIVPPRPHDVRVKVVEGLIELDEGHAEEAIRAWRSALILANGSDAELTWRLAHVLLQLGRVREAEPLLGQFRRLVGGDEPTANYLYLAGLAAFRSGRTAEAIADLESVRNKLDRGLQGQLHQTLGEAYEASREPSKAADAFARAAAVPGSGATPWLALARLQGEERPLDEIATLDRGVIAVGPEPGLLAALARAHWKHQLAQPRERRSWTELEQILEKGRKAAPESPDLALIRADFAATLGRDEDALTVLEAASKLAPTSTAVWLAQVDALNRLGRRDEASARLDRATTAAGDQAAFRVMRARLALLKGEIRTAKATLVEGIDRVPAEQKPVLWKALGEFHAGQADPTSARRAFGEWARLRPDSNDPHLALLDLAIADDDDAGINAEVEALKAIGGPRGVYWKIARAEALLRPRPGGALAPEALNEAATLAEEVKAAAPRQPAGHLLEGRLNERRSQPETAILAYRRALDLKGGTRAIRPLVGLLAGLGRVDELDALRLKAGPFPPEVERLAGTLLLRGNSPKLAEDLARKLVEGDPAGLDGRAWQARVLGALGRSDEAEKALRALVERDPSKPAPWIQLLMFQMSRGNLGAASATVERMARVVRSERSELLVAIAWRIARRTDRADLAYAEALRLHPDEAATLQSAGDYYEATGRPVLAEPLLRRALASRPGLDWARRRLALILAGRVGDRAAWSEALTLVGDHPDPSDTPDDRLCRASVLALGPPGRRPEALAILEALAVDLPDNSKVLEALARTLLASGDRTRGRDVLTRAAALADVEPSTIRLLASVDLAAGDPAAAARSVARLDALGGDDPALLDLKVRVLKGSGKTAEAVALLERLERDRETSLDGAESTRNSVRLLISLGDPAAAERVARRSMARGGFGSIVLAELLGSTGRSAEAVTLYESLVRIDRSSVDPAIMSILLLASMTHDSRWIDLADRLIGSDSASETDSLDRIYARAALRHLQGRGAESVKFYDQLAARQPANLLFLNNCAWILSEELNRPIEGLTRVESLIARVGAQPHALDTRGVILTRLGRFDEAIRDLEDAERAIPSGPIRFHLGRAYLAAGRATDAENAWKRAREGGLKSEQLQPHERAEWVRLVGSIDK